MAGGSSVRSNGSGLGPALRKVRERRGVSLAEAARDTRIRSEFLEAIEAGEYERLLGDVHARACLRSYATYLGVSPERVLELYGPSETQPEAPPPRLSTDPDLRLPRRRDDARLLLMVAAAVLVLAGAFGVLSARDPAPAPAPMASATAALVQVAPPGIEVAVLARKPVEVTVTIDDAAPQTFRLEEGEGRSFEADASLRLRLSSGLTAEVTVNGKDLGMPGRPGKPWSATWRYASPSEG
jgi:cytoskeletal protein RodZ